MLTINWPDSFHLGSVALVNFVVCLRIMILVEGNVIESSTSLSAFRSYSTSDISYYYPHRVNVIQGGRQLWGAGGAIVGK